MASIRSPFVQQGSLTSAAVGLSRRKFLSQGTGAIACMMATASCGSNKKGSTSTSDGNTQIGNANTTSNTNVTSNPNTTSVCTLTPEQEEGPYYVDAGLYRSNILDGQTGVALQLTITVIDATTCVPIASAAVDTWQANAAGVYSDEQSENTSGQTYLRGVQLTDSNGQVTFNTIYPGWYGGRANHFHLKVRIGGTCSGASYSTTGSTVAHGGQLFFPADMNTQLRSVYTQDSNPFTANTDDRVYSQQGGNEQVVTMSGSMTAGYTGTITVAVNRSASH